MILTLPNFLWVCVGESMILTLTNFVWVCVGWLMILTLPNFLWVYVGWSMILTLPNFLWVCVGWSTTLTLLAKLCMGLHGLVDDPHIAKLCRGLVDDPHVQTSSRRGLVNDPCMLYTRCGLVDDPHARKLHHGLVDDPHIKLQILANEDPGDDDALVNSSSTRTFINDYLQYQVNLLSSRIPHVCHSSNTSRDRLSYLLIYLQQPLLAHCCDERPPSLALSAL
jgi:hypothetical protein